MQTSILEELRVRTGDAGSAGGPGRAGPGEGQEISSDPVPLEKKGPPCSSHLGGCQGLTQAWEQAGRISQQSQREAPRLKTSCPSLPRIHGLSTASPGLWHFGATIVPCPDSVEGTLIWPPTEGSALPQSIPEEFPTVPRENGRCCKGLESGAHRIHGHSPQFFPRATPAIPVLVIIQPPVSCARRQLPVWPLAWPGWSLLGAAWCPRALCPSLILPTSL